MRVLRNVTVMIGLLGVIGCGKVTGLAPSAALPVESPAAAAVVPGIAPALVALDTPPPQSAPVAVLNCDGPVKGKEATYDWQWGAAVRIKELAECPADFLLAIYSTPDPFGYANQVLVSLADVRVAAGETVVLSPGGIPACGKFQADVWRGLSVDAVRKAGVDISPATGASVNSYVFGDTGVSCTPVAPQAPPTCPGSPAPVATFLGSTDTDQDPGTGTRWTLAEQFAVRGAGIWEVRLYGAATMADYAADRPQYTKDAQTVTLVCAAATTTLSVAYSWDGHGSEIWWSEARLNNVPVAKGPAVANPHN